MTEDEAKTQDCIGPEGCGTTVPADGAGRAWSLSQQQFVRRVCKGSACKMAWRWSKWATKEDPRKEGYCGLAGEP